MGDGVQCFLHFTQKACQQIFSMSKAPTIELWGWLGQGSWGRDPHLPSWVQPLWVLNTSIPAALWPGTARLTGPAEPDGLSSRRRGPCPLLSTPNPSQAAGPRPVPPTPGEPLGVTFPQTSHRHAASPAQPRVAGDGDSWLGPAGMRGLAHGSPLREPGKCSPHLRSGRAPVHTGSAPAFRACAPPAAPHSGPRRLPRGTPSSQGWGAPAETGALQGRAWGRRRQQARLWPSQGPSSCRHPCPHFACLVLVTGQPRAHC